LERRTGDSGSQIPVISSLIICAFAPVLGQAGLSHRGLENPAIQEHPMANASAVAEVNQHEYSIGRVIMASSVGTMIEWYDFYIFGSLAAILGPKFYPPGNDTFA
jgi:hypothetical protein